MKKWYDEDGRETGQWDSDKRYQCILGCMCRGWFYKRDMQLFSQNAKDGGNARNLFFRRYGSIEISLWHWCGV